MIVTKGNYTLENLYKVYIYTSDGNCTSVKCYDYNFENGWFVVDCLTESKYFKESIVDMIFIEDIVEVKENEM